MPSLLQPQTQQALHSLFASCGCAGRPCTHAGSRRLYSFPSPARGSRHGGRGPCGRLAPLTPPARGATGEAPLGCPASPGRSGASSQRVSTPGSPVAVTGRRQRSDAGTQRLALPGAEPRAGFRRGKRTWEERHLRDRVRFKLAGGSFKPGRPGAPFTAALADR